MLLHRDQTSSSVVLFETCDMNVYRIRSDIRMEIESIARASTNPRGHFFIVSNRGSQTNNLEIMVSILLAILLAIRLWSKLRRELSHTRNNNFIGRVAFIKHMQLISNKELDILIYYLLSLFPFSGINIPILRGWNNDIILSENMIISLCLTS